MQSAGLESWYPMEWLAVRGYVEVLRPAATAAASAASSSAGCSPSRRICSSASTRPDFNLDLEAALRSAGIHHRALRQPVDLGLARRAHPQDPARGVQGPGLFPVRAAIYEKAGVPVTYVGHPLADELPRAAGSRGRARAAAPVGQADRRRAAAGQPPERSAAAGRALRGDRQAGGSPGAECAFPGAAGQPADAADLRGSALPPAGRRAAAHASSFGHAHMAMTAADASWSPPARRRWRRRCSSAPMVITYRMPRLSAWIMKRKGYLPYVGLPNILAGEWVVPEILQDDATPENLAAGARQPAARQGSPQSPGAALPRDPSQRCGRDTAARAVRCDPAVAADQGTPGPGDRRPGRAPGGGLMVRLPGVLVCGVDEAGRGPLAGPVYAACVILARTTPSTGLADSKVLTAARREELACADSRPRRRLGDRQRDASRKSTASISCAPACWRCGARSSNLIVEPHEVAGGRTALPGSPFPGRKPSSMATAWWRRFRPRRSWPRPRAMR